MRSEGCPFLCSEEWNLSFDFATGPGGYNGLQGVDDFAVRRIEMPLAVFAGFDKPAVDKNLHVVGKGWLRNGKAFQQSATAHFPF